MTEQVEYLEKEVTLWLVMVRILFGVVTINNIMPVSMSLVQSRNLINITFCISF